MSQAVQHRLDSRWVYWAHSLKETDWTITGYHSLGTFGTVEEMISLHEAIPKSLMSNCMFFIMKEGIAPIWEDPANIDGGSLSYKVKSAVVPKVWEKLLFLMAGNTLTSCPDNVNGISVSPKRSFSIVKIWTINGKQEVVPLGKGLAAQYKRHVRV